MRILICFIVLIVVCVNSATQAQASGGPPMITDDPGTPGDGHWEINIAALTTRDSVSTTYQVPLIDVNYGLGDRVQLKFEVPWLIQNNDSGTNQRGIGNSLTGVKWRFYDAGEKDWLISTYPQIESTFPFPSTYTNELAESGTSYLLPVEFEHDFDSGDINFEIGRWFRAIPTSDSWLAGFVFTREIRKGVEVIGELHEEIAVQQPQDELILNLGTRWCLSEQYTLLFSVGRDLHNTMETPNFLMTYLGLQMHY